MSHPITTIDLDGRPLAISDLDEALAKLTEATGAKSEGMCWLMHPARFSEVGRTLGAQLKMNAPKKDAPKCSKCGQRIGEYKPPNPLEIRGVGVRLTPGVQPDVVVLTTDDRSVDIVGIG